MFYGLMPEIKVDWIGLDSDWPKVINQHGGRKQNVGEENNNKKLSYRRYNHNVNICSNVLRFLSV